MNTRSHTYCRRKRHLRGAALLTPTLLALTSLAVCMPGRTAAQDSSASSGAVEWPAYGGDPGGARYSPLTQINRDNVTRLEVAWVYRTGDIATREKAHSESGFEATPLFVDNTLYLSTPFGRVIALDPERGTPKWSYDPKVDITAGYGDFNSRGVSTWLDTRRAIDEPCHRRIFIAAIDARLIALDAATGKPCADFGKSGAVDLRRGLRNGVKYHAEYEETSPPAVIHDFVIVGSAIADNYRYNAPSGVVRAFDARTGVLRWSWDPVPQDSTDPAWSSWRGPKAHDTGAANVWSIITTDSARDLVFVPTGSPSPDYFGGERLGNNLYANSLVALRASTGKVAWHFQVVHHDLWDYDVPAAPALFTVRRDGKEIPAVAQATKVGHLFILNRETGEPLFPVEERPVPRSDVAGEETSPTQPFPTRPEPLVSQKVTADDAWGITDADRKWCRARMASLRADGVFTPPSIRGTLVVPGNVGGAHWGGVAIDPERGLIVVPTNRLPAVVRLIPRERYDAEERANREGEISPQNGTAYGMWRQFLLTPNKIPCTAPPWGTLTAIDAASGAVRWEVPLGTIPWIPKEANLRGTGSINLAGPIVTAGGLVFIGAAFDNHLRAFDVESGAELWAGELPVGGRATPMTYRAKNGKQYVVIAAGGHPRTGLALGDYLVAFAVK